MIFDEQPATRQELYERIRATSHDQVVLEEMIRLGFWPERGTMPADPTDEIRRRTALQQELRQLQTQHRRLRDEAALKRELRKRRMAESRRKQKETKERRQRERRERAEAWARKKEAGIVYLGEGVSAGLNHEEGDAAKLGAHGLPALQDAAGIAQAMGMSVGQLRFLAFSREVSKVNHYQTFALKKKTGGTRTISAPMPRLKAAQHWILQNLLQKVEVHEAAHGFRPGRSIVSNARPHVGAAVLVNLDLEDFFGSIPYPRVKAMFRWLGYSEAAATIFGLLCTAHDTQAVELDGTVYHVAQGARRLPQGAPTSPAITNILCIRLDRRLAQAAGKLGFGYTRYADDLSFSAAEAGAPVGKLLRQVRWLVERDGLRVHPRKTRVLRASNQQEVTGVVVNERPTVARQTLRRFRATLFQIEKDGPEGKRWGPSGNVMAAILGYAHFVHMVDPQKGEPLVARVKAIHAQYGYTPPPPPKKKKKKKGPAGGSGAEADDSRPSSQAGTKKKKKKKKWWRQF